MGGLTSHSQLEPLRSSSLAHFRKPTFLWVGGRAYFGSRSHIKPSTVSEMNIKSRLGRSVVWLRCDPRSEVPLCRELRSPLVVRGRNFQLSAECCPELPRAAQAAVVRQTERPGKANCRGASRALTTQRQQPRWPRPQDKTNIPPAEPRTTVHEDASPTCGCRQLSVPCSSADWSWVGHGCSTMSCEDHCPSA